MSSDELSQILEKHQAWLNGRADARVNVDLRDGALMYAGDDTNTAVNHVHYSGIKLDRVKINGANLAGARMARRGFRCGAIG